MTTIIIQNASELADDQYTQETYLAWLEAAGLTTVVKSLVSQVSTITLEVLLLDVKNAVATTNPPLAEGLTAQGLAAYLAYMSVAGELPLVKVSEARALLDEDGPAGVWASYNGTAVLFTFSESATHTDYFLHVDGVLFKRGNVAPEGGTVNDSVTVALQAGSHTAAVCFIDDVGKITRLTISEAFAV